MYTGIQCHLHKVHTHGQILVTLHVLPDPIKHVHDVAEKFTYALPGSPPQTVILTDYSLKSEQILWESLSCQLIIPNVFKPSLVKGCFRKQLS